MARQWLLLLRRRQRRQLRQRRKLRLLMRWALCKSSLRAGLGLRLAERGRTTQCSRPLLRLLPAHPSGDLLLNPPTQRLLLQLQAKATRHRTSRPVTRARRGCATKFEVKTNQPFAHVILSYLLSTGAPVGTFLTPGQKLVDRVGQPGPLSMSDGVTDMPVASFNWDAASDARWNAAVAKLGLGAGPSDFVRPALSTVFLIE